MISTITFEAFTSKFIISTALTYYIYTFSIFIKFIIGTICILKTLTPAIRSVRRKALSTISCYYIIVAAWISLSSHSKTTRLKHPIIVRKSLVIWTQISITRPLYIYIKITVQHFLGNF